MNQHIVILGAGYGGIMTAQHLQRTLGRSEATITLINKHDYHYITTHLHKPAAGTDHPDNVRIPIHSLINPQKVNFIKSTVSQIVPEEKKVILEDQTIQYDYLVIAMGSDPETFGIEGLQEYALSIRSINSVRLIRDHIQYQLAKFKSEPERMEYLTFVIGGAGFTGIEFVGELANQLPEMCKAHDIDPKLVQIHNVDASPNALPPGFNPELVDYAVNLLQNKGVQFKFSTAIKACTPDGVVLSDGQEIKASTVIWTGGVRGNRLVEESGFESIRGRVKVDEYLRAIGHDNTFIIGDCSLVLNEEGRPYPPTAQIAIQQGQACAHNLTAVIRNLPLQPFKPSIKGTVVSLGKGEAVGMIGKYKLKGALASFMKMVIDLRYLYMIGGISLIIRKGRFTV